MSNLIQLKNISLVIENISIINNISLNLGSRGITLITGHNGAGKSSLLRLMAGFTKPTKGNITYKDCQKKLPIGFVFQKPVMLDRNVNENLLHALTYNGNTKNSNQNLINETLRVNNVFHLRDLSAKKISVGEQQIVSMLRALMVKPSILFLDEPTSSLDPQYTKIVENLILEASVDIKIVLVTQSAHHLRLFNDEIVHLSKGELIEQIS
jgi:tungstate transport system ATP-binding protein